METFVTKVLGKYSDSGLLGVIHQGDYGSHFGVDQVLQSEFYCGIVCGGFSITPTCASHITTALASGEYVHYVPDISHWLPVFRCDWMDYSISYPMDWGQQL